ncbi:MAG TPA: thiamine pyrophosphate-dependent dehydrogenase E1 component subunit alpha [Candidatus Krumholzibacteria bacterium]|jgi:TPP-dependent pyruvate/acetoin dehydrogenase alpha subunit
MKGALQEFGGEMLGHEKAKLSRQQLVEMHRLMLLNRMVEERLGNLYRQGKVVGGLYSSLGQEGISVASAYALRKGDKIGPMIRNLGAMLVKGVQPREVFCQYMAREGGPTFGRDCNLHFGDLERDLVAPISMLGTLIPVMAGMALASQMRGEKNVMMTYIGDGGSSTGDFHEGLNLAAVWKLPLILICENNGYAYSTPTHMQMANTRMVDRAKAYGVRGDRIDGNDVTAVYHSVRRAARHARSGKGPVLIEAMSFRMKGHAEHDDAGYVPTELVEAWRHRDPITRLTRYLLEKGLATRVELDALVEPMKAQIDADTDWALASPMPRPEFARGGVFAGDGDPRTEGARA